MKYLVMLVIVPQMALAQNRNYSVSYIDPNSGSLRFLSATVTENLTLDEERAIHHEKMMEYFAAARQRRYQEEQLRLLRQIANQ
jgi:hypothetical protein